jgi:soluble cytochrome b562
MTQNKTQMITEELVPSQEFANMIKESEQNLSAPVPAEVFITWLEEVDQLIDQGKIDEALKSKPRLQ